MPNARAGSSYRILLESQPTEESAKLARVALQGVGGTHENLFKQGALVGLLSSGGYLIVEYDPSTNRAFNLYLVSRSEDGQQIVQSEEIVGQLTVRDVEDVAASTQIFMTKLLRSPISQLVPLLNEFFKDVPTYGESEDESYFAIPRHLLGFGSRLEIQNLSALFAGLQVWPIRYAMSLKDFAVNPIAAFHAALEQRDKLVHEFLAARGERDDYFYDLQDLDAIHGPTQLKDRLRWLKDLDAYLDAHVLQAESRWVFDLNASIATIPLGIGGDRDHGSLLFSSVTATGLLPYWRRRSDGGLGLVELSHAE